MKSYLLAVVAVLSISALIVASDEKRPKRDESTCDRLEKLEAEVAKLRSGITLRSPDGKRSVEIVARNDVAGIWVKGNEKREGCAAIYATRTDGAVIGLFGPDGMSKPMAFAASSMSIGSIQYENKQGQPAFMDLMSSK